MNETDEDARRGQGFAVRMVLSFPLAVTWTSVWLSVSNMVMDYKGLEREERERERVIREDDIINQWCVLIEKKEKERKEREEGKKSEEMYVCICRELLTARCIHPSSILMQFIQLAPRFSYKPDSSDWVRPLRRPPSPLSTGGADVTSTYGTSPARRRKKLGFRAGKGGATHLQLAVEVAVA